MVGVSFVVVVIVVVVAGVCVWGGGVLGRGVHFDLKEYFIKNILLKAELASTKSCTNKASDLGGKGKRSTVTFPGTGTSCYPRCQTRPVTQQVRGVP